MECLRCKSANPDGQKYCGNCGAALTPGPALSDVELKEKISAVVKETLKDQKVVEVEIAESVAARVTGWSKLIGVVAGIPLAILIFVLGIFGVQKYSDLLQVVDNARTRVESVNTQAEKLAGQIAGLEPQIARIKDAADRVAKVEQEFNAKLAEAETRLDRKVADLDKKVDDRVSGIQGDVDKIKRAFEIIGKSYTPAEFREYLSTIRFGEWKPEFVVLHNTVSPKLADWHRVSGETRMQGFAKFFAETQHFSGGPHLIIDDKVIWVFNPLTRPGVHAARWNSASLGVEMVGDYSSEPFDEHVRDNTVEAIAALYAVLKLKADADTLRFHRDMPGGPQRNCPGKNVDKADMLRRIAAALPPPR